ncbi:MAG: DUF6055 domain-containing protein [Terricaulis sp.]
MRTSFAFIALALVAGSATAQTLDQHLSGEVTKDQPTASFPLHLEAGQIVTLTTATSSNLDTVLTLNGPDGQSIAQNDDVEPGVLTSRVVFVAQTAGAYTAVVSGYGESQGPFELNVRYGLDVGLSDAARTLRETTISLDAQHTESSAQIDLNSGDVFVATTFALTEGLDTTLTLRDAGGTTLAQNDDRGDGTLNSQIIYQAARGGRYEVVTSTYGANGVGDAMVSLAIDPNAEAPFNFATIEGAPIATYVGELNAETTTRTYPVRLRAGQTLLAVADATSGNLDTVLRLADAEGNPVAINDDRGDGSLNAAFAYTAPVAETYQLELSRFPGADDNGAFRLVLSSVDASVVATLQALAQVRLSGTTQTIQTQDFLLSYTLEGVDATTEAYAQETARALQTVLHAQTNLIGWAPPVRDSSGRYLAYIGQANGSMGYTKPVEMVFDNAATAGTRETAAARAVFVIDNDFAGMNKKAPIESLMRATATHEFNHVAQFSYDAQEGLNWLYESTASWTETVTVGVEQDATDYVETDYATPELCWTTLQEGRDYAQWTLLQSMADLHGKHFIVRIWENAIAYDGFETMSQSLASVGSTIPEALLRWRAQNFARDYALAPRFTRTVASAGRITGEGSWIAQIGVEQLGAHYVTVALSGPRTFTLNGDDNLELVGLGRRNGRIEVIPLGRVGVFDASQFEYAALMVFNHALPPAPGDCTGVTYSITATTARGPMPSPQYSFSARHFAPPS